jgi:hypothetical protein
MNLATIGAILGAITSGLAIFAYLDKGIRKNKARLRAEKGRVISLAEIVKIQSKRIEALEFYASLPKEQGGEIFRPNNELIDLENEAKEAYKKHQTELT